DPRRDIVRVADLIPVHRSLAADLARTGHLVLQRGGLAPPVCRKKHALLHSAPPPIKRAVRSLPPPPMLLPGRRAYIVQTKRHRRTSPLPFSKMEARLAKMESRNILNFRDKQAPGTVGRNLPKSHRLKETEGVLFKGKESCGSRHRLERGQGRRAEGARKGPRLSASQRGARAVVSRGHR